MPTFQFGGGRPDPASFPVEGLVEAAMHGIPRMGGQMVAYPEDKGHSGLREVAAKRFRDREGVEVPPDHIALTTGSMQAVTLMADAFAGPGEIILTEEFTYSGTLAAYRRRRARLIGIPLDEDGMRTDALEATLGDLKAKGEKPRFIYAIPNYQNPTGSVMPLHRRKELLEIAKRHDVLVVDDNCYTDVDFEDHIVPSLYTLGEPGRAIYIGSFSKILAAGIRLGYFIAPPPLLQRVLEYKDDGGTTLLASCIVAEFFREHLWDHVRRINGIVGEKRDTMLAALQEHLGDLCTWSRPAGGLFLWVKLPETTDTRQLQQLAAEEGIAYATGRAFHVYDQDVKYLRLAFGYPALDEIKEGIRRLGRCVRAAQTA